MAVLKRRSRMVNFRLSESEYEELRNFCLSQGARSVSDVARWAVCRVIGNGHDPNGEPVEAAMRRLDGKVEELDRELKRLAGVVERQPISARS